jgi:tetratricopeptide (TPR) repeat protein
MTPDAIADIEARIEAARRPGDPAARALAVEYLAAAGPPAPTTDPARAPWFRARYVAAQAELAAGFPARAAVHLHPLAPHLTGVPAELAARVRLVAAEAFARAGRPAEGRAELAAVPATGLGPLVGLRVVRVRLMLGEVQELAAEVAACERELADDRANLAVLLCEVGRAWDAAQDLDRAERCWERAEVLTRPLGPHPARTDALVQLGRLAHLRGRFAAAAARYDEAAGAADGGPFAPEVAWRRVLLQVELGEDASARRAADVLLAGTPPSDLPDEVRPVAAVACAVLTGAAWPGAPAELMGYLADRAGDHAAAACHFADALAAAPAAERQARLSFALGRACAASGQHREAAGWLARAEELARARWMPEVIARSLEARGQVAAERSGDEESARDLFEEAVRVSEAEAARARSGLDGAAHRWRRSSVLRRLVRSAARRDDAAAVFRYQELERGRFLLDLLTAAGRPLDVSHADFAAVQHELAACESRLAGRTHGPNVEAEPDLRRREELLLRRDRLFEAYLRERARAGDGLLPPLPGLRELRARLWPGSLYLAPTVVGEDVFLLAIRAGGEARVLALPGAAGPLAALAQDWRNTLVAHAARYRAGLTTAADRRDLNDLLDRAGAGPLGEALNELLDAPGGPPRRVVWVPDGPLHGFPIHAARRRGRHLVERIPFAWSCGGAVLSRQAQSRDRRGGWRSAVVVAADESDLPGAAAEAREVAGAFWRSQVLGPGADRVAVSARLARARLAHFACHAEFDPEQPFASAVVLPSGERVTALEWLGERVAGLGLVALSACRSAEVGTGLGRQTFGLVSGLLGGGVRAVLAGLWPLPDRETRAVVGAFYRHRRDTDLADALARAQRDALADAGSSPFTWAGLTLHGDPNGLPSDGRLARLFRRFGPTRCPA